jgi:hypothetical protein
LSAAAELSLEKKNSLVDLPCTSGIGEEETENVLYLRGIEIPFPK